MGKSRSGKDTVAELIRKHSSFPIAIVGFGDELKQHCAMLFPKVDNHMKPRDMYEHFGEACREIYQDVWVDQLEDRVEQLKQIGLCSHFVINDLRQPNEHQWCLDNGYTIIKVVADDTERTIRAFGTDSTFSLTNHSERFIDDLDYDFVISNSYSKEALENQVIQLLKIMEGQET